MVEMECEYEVQDLYGRAVSYYKDEYLCLWEVTPNENVAHCDWDIIIKNDNWYKEEILPTFKRTIAS
jgi:hypothetical protein